MFLPSLPGWDGLHPLVVHFPIALLLVAPVFVVLGLVLPRAGRGFLVGALVLPRLLRRPEKPGLTTVLTLGFLVAYLYATTVLANAAHAGGQLVHAHGVHAKVAPANVVSDGDDR